MPSRRPSSGGLRIVDTVTKAASYITNTEAEHKDFFCKVRRENYRITDSETKIEYFRFNAPTGDDDFNLNDYTKMDAIKKYTEDYLVRPDVEAMIEKCASLLAK